MPRVQMISLAKYEGKFHTFQYNHFSKNVSFCPSPTIANDFYCTPCIGYNMILQRQIKYLNNTMQQILLNLKSVIC